MKSNEELWREVRRVQAKIAREMMEEEKQADEKENFGVKADIKEVTEKRDDIL